MLNKHLRKYKIECDTRLSRPCHKAERLVHISRSERCFLSHKHLPSTQEISSFRLPRHLLRIHSSSVRVQFETPNFLCAEAGVAPLRLSGLRIRTFIYHWLIIAKSKEKESLVTGRVLAHITSLGFKVNASKSNLTPSQNVIFLGLELNSVSMRAHLSQECVRSLMDCLSQFREGARVQYRTCLRLQGLMASSIQVVPMGLLRMRAFTKWVLSLHFSLIPDLCRSVTVTRACSAALRHWESENFYARGTPLDGYDA